MRAILFRGKCIDNGEWRFGCYTELPEGDIGGTLTADTNELLCEDTAAYIVGIETKQRRPSRSSANPFEVFDVDWYKVRPETVGQYTGLKDKNGKRIFEGDIVRFDYVNDDGNDSHEDFLIFFAKGAFFAQYLGNIKCAPNTLYDEIGVEECYVVGNKWDNPELLEMKK